MSKTSLHHCESDIALWNKAELQVFSHQRFNYCCAEIKRPIQFVERHAFTFYIVYNELIEILIRRFMSKNE